MPVVEWARTWQRKPSASGSRLRVIGGAGNWAALALDRPWLWRGQCLTTGLEGGMGDLVARRYEKDPSVVYREIAGEAILVPIRRNVADMESIYTLDSVGAVIWDLIDGERTLVDILDALLGEYDVEANVLSRDLDEFVEQLASVGAIRAV